jgi:hypothetical protein
MNDKVTLDEHVETYGSERGGLRALTADEYAESRGTDTFWLSQGLILFGGWIPVGIVAIVAGFIFLREGPVVVAVTALRTGATEMEAVSETVVGLVLSRLHGNS